MKTTKTANRLTLSKDTLKNLNLAVRSGVKAGLTVGTVGPVGTRISCFAQC
jgi:hypothetical protein